MGVFFSRNGRCRCLTNHVGLQVVPKNAGTQLRNSGILWLFKSEMSESTTFPGGSQLGGPQLGCFFQPRIANPMDLVQDWEEIPGIDTVIEHAKSTLEWGGGAAYLAILGSPKKSNPPTFCLITPDTPP